VTVVKIFSVFFDDRKTVLFIDVTTALCVKVITIKKILCVYLYFLSETSTILYVNLNLENLE